MKHTTGQWEVTKGTNGFCETWQVHMVNAQRACTIADCGCVTNEVYQGSTDNYVGKQANEEHKANAMLVASAPDLLAACKSAIAALTQNATYSADIALAVKNLTEAVSKAQV